MTLELTDWPISKVTNIFPVTKYIAKEARKLVRAKGILALPDPKKGSKVLPDETLKAVNLFYHNDEYSREMPGKKDCISKKKCISTKTSHFM